MTKIKEARIKSGLTQSVLAIKAGVEPSRLSLIERGKRCTQRTAAKLAKVLNADPEAIFPDFQTLREG